MNLAIGYGGDINGKIYYHAIEPDISLNGVDKFNDPAIDEKNIICNQMDCKPVKVGG